MNKKSTYLVIIMNYELCIMNCELKKYLPCNNYELCIMNYELKGTPFLSLSEIILWSIGIRQSIFKVESS